MADSTLLEQYKALIGDVGNIGTRYATANGFYLSIVSALLGVVAFTESGKPLAQVDLVLVLTVAAFAVVVCHVWMKRSEERRVGKECSCGWVRRRQKKKRNV